MLYPERTPHLLRGESKDRYPLAKDPSATLGISVCPLIGTGLFYATYLLSARWFDVARIDSLYVFLILSALFVFVHYRGARAAIISGLLFTLAFFTKQNALIVALPMLLAGLLLSRRQALMTAAVFALCLSVSLPIANHMSEGWFYYYVFEVPAAHRVDTRYYVDFWTKDLAANLWPLMLLLAASWGHVWRHDRRRALQYLALAAGLMAAAYGGRLHRYGWSNVLIPAHLCLALCTALALAHWLRVGQHKQIIASLLLVLGQMALLLYKPVYFIPSHDDVRQGDAFMQKIAAIDGDVFMPGIQFVPTRIGKTSYSYGFAAIDVLLTRTSEHAHVRDGLRQELAGALAEKRFSATVTSYLADRQQMEQYYDAVEQIDYPKMVAGFQPRPSWLMLPKKEK